MPVFTLRCIAIATAMRALACGNFAASNAQIHRSRSMKVGGFVSVVMLSVLQPLSGPVAEQ
ncbi:hypothetical protein AC630_31765 [Bradyrhizobium sp. AS23.2]|nr:hypothetical protein AC630_31765 [Bradyrhizobium sp. AS23.2]